MRSGKGTMWQWKSPFVFFVILFEIVPPICFLQQPSGGQHPFSVCHGFNTFVLSAIWHSQTTDSALAAWACHPPPPVPFITMPCGHVVTKAIALK